MQLALFEFINKTIEEFELNHATYEYVENNLKRILNEALTKNTEFKKILVSTSMFLVIGLILSFCLSVFFGNIFLISGIFLTLMTSCIAILFFKFININPFLNFCLYSNTTRL